MGTLSNTAIGNLELKMLIHELIEVPLIPASTNFSLEGKTIAQKSVFTKVFLTGRNVGYVSEK